MHDIWTALEFVCVVIDNWTCLCHWALGDAPVLSTYSIILRVELILTVYFKGQISNLLIYIRGNFGWGLISLSQSLDCIRPDAGTASRMLLIATPPGRWRRGKNRRQRFVLSVWTRQQYYAMCEWLLSSRNWNPFHAGIHQTTASLLPWKLKIMNSSA